MPSPEGQIRIHPLITFHYGLKAGSRTKPQNAVRSILDAWLQDVIPSPREWILRCVGNVAGHHTPNKAGQLSGYSGFGNVVFGSKSDFIKFAL